MNWPVSRPRLANKKEVEEIPNNPMEIMSGGRVVLIIDWWIWLWSWRVVISDAGNGEL